MLDTCTFLWIVTDASELSANAKALFSTPTNKIYLSTVSTWEIIVKYQLGKLPLPNPPMEFIIKERKLHQIETLPLQENAVGQLLQLPIYHNDPFDRMLICQAIASDLTLLTPDKHISQYPVATIW